MGNCDTWNLLDDKGDLITQISTYSQWPISIRTPSQLLGCDSGNRGITAVFRRMAMGRRFFGLERRASVVAHSNRKRSFGSARRRRGSAMRTSKIEF